MLFSVYSIFKGFFSRSLSIFFVVLCVPCTWYYYIHDGIFIHIKLINIKLEQVKKSFAQYRIHSLAQSFTCVLCLRSCMQFHFFQLRILFSHINTFMQMVCAWAEALNMPFRWIIIMVKDVVDRTYELAIRFRNHIIKSNESNRYFCDIFFFFFQI